MNEAGNDSTRAALERRRWQRIFVAMILTQLVAVLLLFHALADNYAALGLVKYAVIGSIFVASRSAVGNFCRQRRC